MKEYDAVKEYVNMKKQITIKAVGKSMLPTIKEGDIITISNDINSLHVGDIVLFYNANKNHNIYILHRIISSVKDKIFITKGDNNKFSDQPIRKSRIIGKVVLIQSKEYNTVISMKKNYSSYCKCQY